MADEVIPDVVLRRTAQADIVVRLGQEIALCRRIVNNHARSHPDVYHDERLRLLLRLEALLPQVIDDPTILEQITN